MGDVDVALRLEALGDGAWLEEVDGLTGRVERGGVAILKADVIEVGVEGHALEFQDRPRLVSGVALLFGQALDGSAVRALSVVEDVRGRHNAAGGDLAIDGPVALQTVVRVD